MGSSSNRSALRLPQQETKSSTKQLAPTDPILGPENLLKTGFAQKGLPSMYRSRLPVHLWLYRSLAGLFALLPSSLLCAIECPARPGESQLASDGKKCNRGASRLSKAWPRPRLGRKTYWHKIVQGWPDLELCNAMKSSKIKFEVLWGYTHASPQNCLFWGPVLEPHFAQSCARFLLLYCLLGWRASLQLLKVAAHVLVKPWFAAPPPCTFHCFVKKVKKCP